MDQLDNLDKLPTVSEALKLPYDEYRKHADGVLDYREYCSDGFSEFVRKIHDWCLHLNCVERNGSCAPLASNTFSMVTNQNSLSTNTLFPNTTNENTLHVNSSVFDFMRLVGYNGSHCYDDYLCDHERMAFVNHCVLGYGCFFLCLSGVVSNLVLLPAYNLGRNRSGATVFLSAMAVLDLVYLILTLLQVVSRYMPDRFHEQMISYAQFSGRLIPIGLPIMQLCEFVVVWLVVALLANRLLYLKFGFQSKMLCSQLQAFKSVAVLVVFGLAYSGCKFFEYTSTHYEPVEVVRVILTPIGRSPMYRNLIYHWLKVPLQMFLPYLSVGVLISVVVTKMLNFHTSKWKAVASLCNDTVCACVCRTGLCGSACKEGGLQSNKQSTVPAIVTTKQPPFEQSSYAKEQHISITADTDPIEEELAYLFFQLPQVDETREHANVVTAVCIGLLLLIFKVPKFLLHVLSTEEYVTHDSVVFALIDQLLDTVFAACKPTVCILVGAHFRHVLRTPQCHPLELQRQQTSQKVVDHANITDVEMQHVDLMAEHRPENSMQPDVV
ncbi:hypothetical protein EG68_09289 [Paragonimus skrjabini miyazakii]|uniref:G-protein coupled receptors family 1 profile domain-containing protein n=1 Tax=Paragonimus skrjabini miyazakii TaxID=59628 RepID=A0A8S9YCZ2_9TREM|nr:hypothetical protein EG68_09289 [Paragonimus skrjabini miyazakii]